MQSVFFLHSFTKVNTNLFVLLVLRKYTVLCDPKPIIKKKNFLKDYSSVHFLTLIYTYVYNYA